MIRGGKPATEIIGEDVGPVPTRSSWRRMPDTGWPTRSWVAHLKI